MIQLDKQTHELSLAYMQRWFISKTRLATLCGLTLKQLDVLIAAQCAPGVIYCQGDNRHWWSALASLMGNAEKHPPEQGIHWYSTGAVWWLRRAVFNQRNGSTPAQAAIENADHFRKQFQYNISRNLHAHIAYQTAFDASGTIIPKTVDALAASEWQNWLCGGFGVCLPFFTGNTCVRKEVLATRIRLENESNSPEPTPLTSLEVFNLCEELASLILPFAPWEREHGTPGKTIDPLLRVNNLGEERPFTL